MKRKTWYSILGVDAMPLFLKNLLLRGNKESSNSRQEWNLSLLGESQLS
jgi:hypothetical protein